MCKASHYAKRIWDYMLMGQPVQKSQCIFVLGSNDLRVAEYAAQLWLQGYGEFIVFSGGYGNFTRGNFQKPEAELFAQVALALGVPANRIIVENKATNTGENVAFTLKLLQEKGIRVSSWLLVQKPFMERRSLATFQKALPGAEARVTSPPIPFEEYPNEAIAETDLYNTLVGDMQRVMTYPAKGYMTPQPVPDAVADAVLQLLAMGYDKHALK